MIIPDAVQTAARMVRNAHPQVGMVVFTKDGRWLYMNEDGGMPSFDKDMDEGVLEAAAEAACYHRGFPCVYDISQVEPA